MLIDLAQLVMGFRKTVLGIILTFSIFLVSASDQVAEPKGYRLDQYDAPVPATLNGGIVVDVDGVKLLVESGYVIPVDVLPATRKPEGLSETSIWLPAPHYGIPGSLWLPDVGRGELNDQLSFYFQSALEEATSENVNVGLMFYCRPDCWMSWNAAKRAITEFGYQNVHWFPEGILGWNLVSDQTELLTPFEISN